jgi:hypothetical protein
MRKTLTTLAVAAAMAAGTLGFTATQASAHWKGGVYINLGFAPVCQNVWKTYVWYDKSGHKHYAQKIVPVCYSPGWAY